MHRKITGFLLIILLLAIFVLPSCESSYEDTFSIYLAASREVVLTGNNIAAYDAENHSFELNKSGIEKWNSYLTYDDIPKLDKSLFSKDFILSIDGREICRGKFWSYASSASYSGIAILESLFKLDNENNKIHIMPDFPLLDLKDEGVHAALVSYFEKRDSLK